MSISVFCNWRSTTLPSRIAAQGGPPLRFQIEVGSGFTLSMFSRHIRERISISLWGEAVHEWRETRIDLTGDSLRDVLGSGRDQARGFAQNQVRLERVLAAIGQGSFARDFFF